MIYQALKFLAEQLNGYLNQVIKTGDVITSPVAVLQNISRIDDEALKTTNKVIISLVNLSEETTIKNIQSQIIIENETVHYKNPPLNLNLYILLTAVMTNYENALIYLSQTMTFFQGKFAFTKQNSVTLVEGLPDEFKIILDLCSLTFEQSNYLWSTLGGKQHPYACYKVRIVSLEKESTMETRGVIKQVRIEEPNK